VIESINVTLSSNDGIITVRKCD